MKLIDLRSSIINLTNIGLYLVDRVGRRLLTLVSYVGILVSLLMLAIGFTLAEYEQTP